MSLYIWIDIDIMHPRPPDQNRYYHDRRGILGVLHLPLLRSGSEPSPACPLFLFGRFVKGCAPRDSLLFKRCEGTQPQAVAVMMPELFLRRHTAWYRYERSPSIPCFRERRRERGVRRSYLPYQSQFPGSFRKGVVKSCPYILNWQIIIYGP